MPDEPRPTAFEIAVGTPLGRMPAARTRTGRAAAPTPEEALERATLPALERGRCVVSFSGGRDSSAVLAAATAAARRNGLAPPVPVTLRFPGAPLSDEAEWQEKVVAQLGLDDWERVVLEDSFEFVGPLAGEMLRRHGVVWPPNAYVHMPLLELARGGTLLTGMGGDELFASWRWGGTTAVLARRRPPRPRDAVSLALLAAPERVRHARERRRLDRDWPWLAEPWRARARAAVAATLASHPRTWPRYAAGVASGRVVAMARSALDALAADAGASVEHPLLDPGFVASIAAAGGRFGPGDRVQASTSLFGALLPPDVAARTTKAGLNEVLWGEHVRAFADSWDGGGVDPAVVDAAVLRRMWAAGEREFRTAMLLQSAWLHAQTDGS